MKQIIIVSFLALSVGGCSSVSYGPFSAKTLGKDLQIKDMQWAKTLPDGSKETIQVGSGANSSAETTHVLGNVIMTALGASAYGGAGAAAGFAGAEVWQTVKDWIFKPASPTQAEPKPEATLETVVRMIQANPELLKPAKQE